MVGFAKISKKALAIILASAILFAASVTVLAVTLGAGRDVKKHLILNDDGSYGGTLSEDKYGVGAPLCGEYDVRRSDYYTVNDFYYMPSTDTRVIIPEFSPYQQTMSDTSGIAALVMILNYMGKDARGEYSELALLEKYEQINETTVFGTGTSAKGLINLINSIDAGWSAENTSLKISYGDSKEVKQATTKEFLTSNLKAGNFLLVRYESPVGFAWKVVIGYDSLGAVKNTQTDELFDTFGDDVIIFAEPYDAADHCQDGYATERASDFLAWWKQKSPTGHSSNKFDYVVIDPNTEINFNYQKDYKGKSQKLYELHLPTNPDGSYGCTRDAEKYGVISSGNGWHNHTDSSYFKINDFYNMGSRGSRILLKNYTVLQQTMLSSCGICAVGSILKYYGEEESLYDMELHYLSDYEKLSGEGAVKGRGTTVEGHRITLDAWGYTADVSYASLGEFPKYKTYREYASFIRENLSAARPIAVSANLGSGHFLTVIGHDDMGTDYIYDDIIITADSLDCWDGYQDGYNVYSATKFFSQHSNATDTRFQAYIVIYDK